MITIHRYDTEAPDEGHADVVVSGKPHQLPRTSKELVLVQPKSQTQQPDVSLTDFTQFLLIKTVQKSLILTRFNGVPSSFSMGCQSVGILLAMQL